MGRRLVAMAVAVVWAVAVAVTAADERETGQGGKQALGLSGRAAVVGGG